MLAHGCKCGGFALTAMDAHSRRQFTPPNFCGFTPPATGGFTTQDLARCQLMARMVALVYNWWTLFVRLAQPHKHFEAITSRPLLLHGVATQTRHGGQTRLIITSTHAKHASIQAVLTSLAGFLATLKATAEQLTDAQRLRAILTRAFAQFMLTTTGPPPQLASI